MFDYDKKMDNVVNIGGNIKIAKKTLKIKDIRLWYNNAGDLKRDIKKCNGIVIHKYVYIKKERADYLLNELKSLIFYLKLKNFDLKLIKSHVASFPASQIHFGLNSKNIYELKMHNNLSTLYEFDLIDYETIKYIYDFFDKINIDSYIDNQDGYNHFRNKMIVFKDEKDVENFNKKYYARHVASGLYSLLQKS